MATPLANGQSHHQQRMPVYFLRVGGPNFVEKVNHPAYHQLARVGNEITTQVKPKAVVVVSAHWQAGVDSVKINVAEEAGIIYDFNGFPAHYYEYKYPYKGSSEVAGQVMKKLLNAGIKVIGVERGLDHGIWVGFMAAFSPKENPLNVPIVQVSMHDSEDPEQHYRLGQALAGLRDNGILIITSGMAVHNTRDYRQTLATGETMPYTYTFDAALKDCVTAPPMERQAKMSALLKRDIARKAHPTFDHVLPVFVAAGAGGSDVGEQVWTLAEGSLSYAQYRFGKV